MTLSIIIKFSNPDAAGHLAVAGDLPTLQGSDKQVAWATDIRAGIARKIAELAGKGAGVTLGAVRTSDVEHIAKVEGKIADALADAHGSRFAAAAGKLLARAEAKYWIDSRTDTVDGLIRDHL